MANDEHRAKFSMQLPRFVADEPVGLGQVVKRVTSSLGVRPCGACERRAARLDQLLRFTPAARRGETDE